MTTRKDISDTTRKTTRSVTTAPRKPKVVRGNLPGVGSATVGPDVDLSDEVITDSKGRRVTDDYADHAAFDALVKVARGRPSLTGVGATSPKLQIRVPEQLQERVRLRAKVEHKSVSDIVREALEAHLR